MEIEQLANQKRTLRILANEWLVQWFQGFACLNLFARQVVPRRNPIVPHEMSVKIRRERWLLIANFLLQLSIQLLCFFFTSFKTTSLCAQRSSKKCTSIACWTARFFRWKKLSKKAFYLFGLVVLALVTAFGSLFKVREFDVLWPLRLPGFAAFGCIANVASGRVVGNM